MRGQGLRDMQAQLQLGDAEWELIAPKLQSVMSLQRELRGVGDSQRRIAGSGGGGGAAGSPPDAPPPPDAARPRTPGQRPERGPEGRGAEPAPPPSKLAQAQRDLRDALDDPDASDPEIAKLLDTYRDERRRVQRELEAAQHELHSSLDRRQEAVLVVRGLLD